MEQQIIKTFQEHKRRHGSRCIASAISSEGEAEIRYKAGKVLNKYGLKAIEPRSFVSKTTDSRHLYTVSPNLLLDRTIPIKPNEVWVGDITYIPLSDYQWAYLAIWMDLFSRRTVGLHIDDNMQEALIIKAYAKALACRG